jgi:acyl-CoA hydrolase
MSVLADTPSTRLVKGSDLNHHGTLFAGRMAEWFVETCFISAARFVGSPEDLVCVKIHGLAFTKPAKPGDVVLIVAAPAKVGTKSITVGAEVFIGEDRVPAVRGFATFVSVDKAGVPYAHGLSLPPEWIESHRELCADAEKLPKR